ncbi:hypothetical protein ACFVMC_22265 [Nocardia sp. NPDC127579]|uniref:allene oxide cyclase barrel-like domain-containing protein n=1 Tax=Nocardia sp. NPDC127579 TaxID=3345402 RepID=UPI003641AA79
MIRIASAAAVGVLLLSGCADGPTEEILELTAATEQYTALDHGEPGNSIGDAYVYSGSLFDNGAKAGTGGGSCEFIHIDGDEVTTQCVLTIELEQGSLTTQALWTAGASPLDMAITGGTGRYRDAQGVVRVWDIATPSERMRAEITHRGG